ncbi:MAG: hypothetical protein ACKO5Y_01380 [Bacteroidota bacterium]
MRRFLIKTIPFLAILLAMLIARFWLLSDSRFDYYYYPDKDIRNKIVIVGDSKMLTGINDECFALNKIEIVNLSSWGAFPLDHILALKNHKLENNIVVLNISSRIFLLNDSSSIQNSPISIQNILNFRMHKKFSDMINQSAGRWEYERQPSGSMRFNHKFNSKFDYNWEYDSLYHIKLLNNPNLNKKTAIKIQHLKELINQLKLTNKVILIDGPERAIFNQLISNYEIDLFKKIQQELNLSVFDFGIYNDSLFYDSHHLNDVGSTIFSNQLIERIKTIQ